MNIINSGVVAALAMALAACTFSTGPSPSPPSGASGGSAGNLAVPPASSGEPSRAPLEGIPVDGPIEVPESVGWNNPGVSKEQNRADLESCYGYSQGQVQHDIRIEDDRAALRDDDLGLGFFDLNRSMNEFDFKNRRTSLFEDCMASRGYSSN